MRLFAVCFVLLFLAGCGGGSTTPPPDPVPQAACTIDGITTSHELAPGTPGYAGDELTIQALLQGEVPTSIIWDFGGGAIPVSLDDADMPTVELGLPGTYVGRVTVTDSAGLSDAFTFNYTILPESHRIKGISPASPAGWLTQPVEFSLDVDGEMEFATWNFKSGTDEATLSGPTPFVQLTSPGTHEVDVTVTIRSGPTVTRTFPFTVVASPWQQIRRDTGRTLLEVQSLSDGSVAALMLSPGDFRSRHLELMQLTATGLADPAQWSSHSFGAAGALSWADLAENQGRLGVLYTEQEGSGYGEGSSDDFARVFAVSDSLHPDAPADWTFSKVSPYVERGSVALTNAQGSGWSALISSQEEVFWAATDQIRPGAEDWVLGEYDSYSNGIPTLFLTQTAHALVCGVAPRSGGLTHLRVGAPGNFAQVMSASPYMLEGASAKFTAGGGRIAILLNGSEQQKFVAFTSSSQPASPSDWTQRLIDVRSPDSQMLGLALDEDSLFISQASFIERTDHAISYLELLTLSLSETQTPWHSTGVVVDAWTDPFLVPVGETPLIAWRDDNNDNAQLVWAQLMQE